MLTQVCIDTNGGGTWSYENKAECYFRIEYDGKTTARIFGQFLPDPDMLWYRRLKMYGTQPDSEMGEELKPQPTTYDLWNHWQKVKHADIHA